MAFSNLYDSVSTATEFSVQLPSVQRNSSGQVGIHKGESGLRAKWSFSSCPVDVGWVITFLLHYVSVL